MKKFFWWRNFISFKFSLAIISFTKIDISRFNMRERERGGGEGGRSCLSIIRARVWLTNRYISRSSIAVAYNNYACMSSQDGNAVLQTINNEKIKRWKRINIKCSLWGNIKMQDRAFWKCWNLFLFHLQFLFLQKWFAFLHVPLTFRSFNFFRGQNNLLVLI